MNVSCFRGPPPEEPVVEPYDGYDKLVRQETLHDKSRDREILYSLTGDENGSPILFFTPLGGTRRMSLFLLEPLRRYSLKAICVSRPGREGTSHADTVPEHVDMACADILAVLDHLKIEQAGILCMCAGTPFALAFCSRYPERTTRKFLSIAPWTSPADSDKCRGLFKFAANYLPASPLSHVVGSIQKASLDYFSKQTISSQMQKNLGEEEKRKLLERYEELDGRTNLGDFEWVMGSQADHEKMDVAVCLSKAELWGVDYGSKCFHDMTFRIFAGDADTLTTLPATQWLSEQLPNSTLTVVPGGTHDGALMLLAPQLVESLSFHAQGDGGTPS